MRIDIGIGQLDVSSRPEDELKTYALGSCVAVMLWDKVRRIGGMIHIALPESQINKEKAAVQPGYFADTGIDTLVGKFRALGGDPRTTVIKLAGGSSLMNDNNTFDIGRRNVIAAKRYLWKYGMGVVNEDVGGKISRTVSLFVGTGQVLLNNATNKWEL
ncbi:MAG: chemotaxis protein CheD [Spirochaetales bacterium]|nr:chemotaxis protein CheD [Spirochaetales bacterium]